MSAGARDAEAEGDWNIAVCGSSYRARGLSHITFHIVVSLGHSASAAVIQAFAFATAQRSVFVGLEHTDTVLSHTVSYPSQPKCLVLYTATVFSPLRLVASSRAARSYRCATSSQPVLRDPSQQAAATKLEDRSLRLEEPNFSHVRPQSAHARLTCARFRYRR